MELNFENWEAGRFYMNTCPKPVFRDENEPEIEAVPWNMLAAEEAQKIREEQEKIMENEINKFLAFSQNDFKILHDKNREKDKLVEDELINSSFLLFNDNPHGLRAEEWMNGEILYRLKRVNLSFPQYFLREMQQHISRNYVRAHPNANPTPKNCSFIHALSIKAKIIKYLYPLDDSQPAGRFHIWREVNVNSNHPIVYGEAVYRFHNWIIETYPYRASGIFTGLGADIFDLYRREVILKNLSKAYSLYCRLYYYLKMDGFLNHYVTPTNFLEYLKSLKGEDIEKVVKYKQLKHSIYSQSDSEYQPSQDYSIIRYRVINRLV